MINNVDMLFIQCKTNLVESYRIQRRIGVAKLMYL